MTIDFETCQQRDLRYRIHISRENENIANANNNCSASRDLFNDIRVDRLRMVYLSCNQKERAFSSQINVYTFRST